MNRFIKNTIDFHSTILQGVSMSSKLKSIFGGLVVCCCFSILVSNCAPPKPGQGYTDPATDEINELIKKKYSEAVYVVGSATGPKEDFALRKATAQARAEIARVFKSQIDVLQKSYEESVNKEALEEYSQVLEIFASITLSGSTVAKEMARLEKDGSYSAKVLVVVSAEQVKAIIDEKMQAFTSYRAAQAYKELEERVAKEKAAASNQTSF